MRLALLDSRRIFIQTDLMSVNRTQKKKTELSSVISCIEI